jgi:hypothetical protein
MIIVLSPITEGFFQRLSKSILVMIHDLFFMIPCFRVQIVSQAK